MHVSHLRVHLLSILRAIPDDLDGLLVVDSVEDAVASERNEVVLFLDAKGLDLGRRDQNSWITAKFFKLRLDVSEGSRHAQPAGEDALRTYQLVLRVARQLTLVAGVC